MTSENKRKHERIQSLNLSYICIDEDENIVKQGMGRTLNLSETGILLETHFPIELNHVLQLTISLEEDLLDIKGKPVHVRPRDQGKYEIGIQFVELDPSASQIIKKFVNQGGVSKTSSAAEDE
ncbi:MAG: PilZ domain-containing protein [Deltaproteobacteria bacterium]|jgi:c-di-GMP-binding flagellar brake protein YcgR|nr:PilZ domain-containing protein [Deltaproteobacteria bacterium]MBW2582044.1 PilZ domain-containing protein [Deltaproteobacteria bacterium]MBW2657385.1 PilZ domain-containing protein [Deltaproteobacteria bacterium]